MDTKALTALVKMLAQQEHVPEETIKHRLISNTLDARHHDATTLIVDAIRNDPNGTIQAAWDTTTPEHKPLFMHGLYAIAGSPFYNLGEVIWSTEQKRAFRTLANFITGNDDTTAVQAINELTAERLRVYYEHANRDNLDRARTTDARKNLILVDGAMCLCGVPDKTLTRDDLDAIDEAAYDWLLLFC